MKRLRAAVTVPVIAAVSAVVFSCGGDGGKGERASMEADSSSTSAPEDTVRILEGDGFRITVPVGLAEVKGGRGDVLSGRDSYIELSSGNASLLIYRRRGRYPLELQAVLELFMEINRETYMIEASIENYRKIRIDSKPAIMMAGDCKADRKDPGILRAAGVQCGEYFFIIQWISFEGWEEGLDSAMGSFQCP